MRSGGGPVRGLRAGSDEGYLYLALELPAGPIDWDSFGISWRSTPTARERGSDRCPAGCCEARSASSSSWNLCAARPTPRSASCPPTIRTSGQASILEGDDFGRFYRRPATIGVETDGRFDPMFVITNRARFGRDGTFFPAQGYDRGVLSFGTSAGSTLADWYADSVAGLIEIRLPWGLLNVTDPSSRTVLFDRT